MSTQTRAFRPLAQTQNIAVTSTAQPQALNYKLGTVAVRFCNIGSQVVYFLPIEAGDTTTVVTATNGIPLPAGQTEVFTMPTGISSLSVIASGAGSTLYTTVGEGV